MILLLLNNEETLETLKTLEYVERDSSDTSNSTHIRVFTATRTYIGETSYSNTWGIAVLVHPDILKALSIINYTSHRDYISALLEDRHPLVTRMGGS